LFKEVCRGIFKEVTGFSIIFLFLQFSLAFAHIYVYKDPATGEVYFSNVPLGKGWKIYIRESQPLKKQVLRYDNIFEEAGKKYQIDPALLKAIAKVESNFNSHVVSQKGAVGIMQLLPSTARLVGAENLFDPYENIYAAAKYLKYLLTQFQDLEKALAAYNAGPDAVKKYHGIPPFRETQQFVRKVLYYYQLFKR